MYPHNELAENRFMFKLIMRKIAINFKLFSSVDNVT